MDNNEWDIDKTRWYMKHFDKESLCINWHYVTVAVMMIAFTMHVAWS